MLALVVAEHGTGEGARPSVPACVQMVRPVSAGALLLAADLAPAACGAATPPAFRYDARLGGVRTLRTLSAGTIIEAPPAFAIPVIRPGEHLRLRARVGPVAIERDVEALQSARPGERLFVRDAQGSVFSVAATDVAP